MTIRWTPEVEQAYQEQIAKVDAAALDRAVVAVCDAAQEACGDRLAVADFPVRFIVAAVLASIEQSEHPFTPRELEIARLLATGMTDKAVAAELFLSPRTVHAHVANIYTKVGVKTRSALSAWMHTRGLA